MQVKNNDLSELGVFHKKYIILYKKLFTISAVVFTDSSVHPPPPPLRWTKIFIISRTAWSFLMKLWQFCHP